MRRATWMCGAVAGLVAGVLGAPAAWAGTYEVKACGAAAGNENRVWKAGYTDFNGNGHPEFFDATPQCPGEPTILVMRSKPQAGVDATWSSAGYWQLDTESSELRIRGLTIWRYGLKFASSEGTQEWKLFAQSDGGSIAGEDCFLSNGACQLGSSQPMSEASKSTHALNNRWVRWGVICDPGSFKSCRTAGDDNGPKVGMGIWGSVATIEDTTRPRATVGGSLTRDGWHRRAEAYELAAADASGIQSAALAIDGVTVRRVSGSCDERNMKQCSDVSGLSLSPSSAETPIADGEHTALITATDAAGNTNRTTQTLRIDETAPGLLVQRPEGDTVVVDVTETASGLAAAQIEGRPLPGGAYSPIETRIEGNRIVGRVPGGDASKFGYRVTARDGAGNESVVEGVPTTLSATRAVVGRRNRAIKRGRVKAGARQAVTVRGVLRGADGQPLGGRPISFTGALRRTGAGPEPLGQTTTAPDGTYAAVIPAGPSRLVRLVFGGGGDRLPSAKGVSLRVPASSSIRARPKAVRAKGRVRFSGRLATLGQPVPRSGKLLDLQAYDRGRWRTFDTTRARGSAARWRATYRFGTRRGRYPVRVRIRREGSFPFELGYSRRVVVRVR